MCVSKYYFDSNIVVLQSCPGLHIFHLFIYGYLIGTDTIYTDKLNSCPIIVFIADANLQHLSLKGFAWYRSLLNHTIIILMFCSKNEKNENKNDFL